MANLGGHRKCLKITLRLLFLFDFMFILGTTLHYFVI